MANILIVDDSPTEVHVFKTMLEKTATRCMWLKAVKRE